MKTVRIGEILRDRGLLNDAQIKEILELQRLNGQPFGVVASELFGVQEAELWRAWAFQMIDCCPKVYPEDLNPTREALSFLTPREAWAYRLLPTEWTEQEISLVTTAERLPNAMAFAQIKSTVPAVFSIADRVELEQAIRKHFDLIEATKVA